MKKIYNLARALFAVAFIAMAVAACNTMPVGFLRTEGASFSPDTLNVYHTHTPAPHAITTIALGCRIAYRE